MINAAEILKDKKTRTLLKWGLISLLIRLLFMPFTMHPDMLFVNYFPHFLSYHGVIDIYNYLKLNFAASISQSDWFYYPPLTYYTIGFFQLLFRPLTPMFDTWMHGFAVVFFSGSRNIFFMKLPYLLFDLYAAIILLRLFDDNKDSISAFKAWMLNPVVIYVGCIFGQFDVIATFFLVLFLFSVKHEKPYAALLSLGVGAAYKNFPFIFILPAAILLSKNNIERIKLAAVGLLPYFILFIPLYFTSGGFVKYVLFQKAMGQAYAIRTGEKIIFAISYCAILINAFFKSGSPNRLRILANYCAILLVLYFVLFPPSFHYYIWLTPFIIYLMANNKALSMTYYIQMIGMVLLTFRKASFAPLLAPVNLAFVGMPSLNACLNYLIPLEFRDIGNLIVLLSSIYMVYLFVTVIRKPANEKQ
jgi:hypothetical protein